MGSGATLPWSVVHRTMDRTQMGSLFPGSHLGAAVSKWQLLSHCDNALAKSSQVEPFQAKPLCVTRGTVTGGHQQLGGRRRCTSRGSANSWEAEL